MADLQQIKDHKETIQAVLYNQDSVTVTDDGKEYPKNRVKAEYITYEGQRLDNNKQYQPYVGDKIKITISKLTTQDGNTVIKQKALTNRAGQPYVTNDEKEIVMSTEEFESFINGVDLDFEKKS